MSLQNVKTKEHGIKSSERRMRQISASNFRRGAGKWNLSCKDVFLNDNFVTEKFTMVSYASCIIKIS